MNRKRYLRLAFGDDKDAMEEGLRVFLREVGGGGDGVIVVPLLQNFKGSMLAELLGEQTAKAFLRDRTISYGGSTIWLCSDSTLKNFRNAKVYLALWSTGYLVDEIEKLHHLQTLVWVTWLPDESKQWAAAHSPVLF